jgi:hypothetical protein
MFSKSIFTGVPGGLIDPRDEIVAYSDSTSGFLEIPFHGDRNVRPKFPYELPPEYRFGIYARQLVAINNTKVFVVGGTRTSFEDKIGDYELMIFEKERSMWHKMKIKGNLVRVRGFEDWLGGYVFNDYIENKKLPGSELWTQRESGLSPTERWGLYNLDYKYPYAPGILFFYNAYTRKYFEIETNQADSEVILIHNNIAIYRVYDELYKAQIINGEKLDNIELLLKSDLVPDIHWAFYAK